MVRLLPQFQAWLIGAWCMLCIYNYTFSNVQMYSLGMLYTPSQAPNTLVIDFMLSVSASSVAAPSDRLLLGLKE